jgi:Phosphotransferase enzyme family/Domain of unknown function (DUF4111)
MVGTALAAGDLVEGCARAAVGRLRQLLGEELMGAWLIGSGALGGAVAESSDLDLVAVCAHTPSGDLIQRLVAKLTEEAMTWPVRGLEFVLYPRAALASASRSPQFALNLNVGSRMPLHLSTDAAAEPAHWFVIDLAILREHGLVLHGPPARELVAPIPRRWLLDALEDGLAWHAANEPALHQSVLNAGRAWRFAAEGVWTSKDAAAGWVLTRTRDPGLVQAALAIRHGDRSRTLDSARVDRFVHEVQGRVQRTADRESNPTPAPAASSVSAVGVEREESLAGGDMTAVVRVGDTVRRRAGPWTPAVHALLRHLRASGFRQAPEPLGIDPQGREILTLLPGRVATYPLPDFVWSDDTLVSVARLLAAYHDATVGFVPPAGAVWQWPTHQPAEVVCHNDFGPYNLLFQNKRFTGVIDFDTASPGPRVWDLAYAAYRFVPLTDPENPDAPHPGRDRQALRLARFCELYGSPQIRPGDVVDVAIARLGELVAFIVDAAATGDPAQQRVLDRGDTVIYERDIAYLRQHRETLARWV